MGQFAMLTWIAVCETINSHLDTRSTGAVFEPIDPISVDLRDLNAHVEM